MSRWTSRCDIPFSSTEAEIRIHTVDGKQMIGVEGKGQIFLDNCPYFVYADPPSCCDDSGLHECVPFTDNCRLYGLIEKVSFFLRGEADTWK